MADEPTTNGASESENRQVPKFELSEETKRAIERAGQTATRAVSEQTRKAVNLPEIQSLLESITGPAAEKANQAVLASMARQRKLEDESPKELIQLQPEAEASPTGDQPPSPEFSDGLAQAFEKVLTPLVDSVGTISKTTEASLGVAKETKEEAAQVAKESQKDAASSKRWGRAGVILAGLSLAVVVIQVLVNG